MFSSRENQGYLSVFTSRRVGESNWFVMFYWLIITKHTSVNALIHRQQTVCWISAQTKLRNIYRHELIVIYLPSSWWNIKRCIQFRRNSNLQLSLLSFLLFGRDAIIYLVNSSQACGKRRETLKSWNAVISKYIQIYPVIVFCCVREKLLFFNIC